VSGKCSTAELAQPGVLHVVNVTIIPDPSEKIRAAIESAIVAELKKFSDLVCVHRDAKPRGIQSC
jgi:hypothetical protein